MVKKFFIFLGCFLLLHPVLWGQQIFYSEVRPFSFRNSDFSVVGRSGDYIYTYSASKEGYFLNAFNDSMRLIARVNLDFFPREIYNTRFISYPNKILVLYQAIQEGSVVLYAARLDERGLLQGKPSVLGQIETGWFSKGREYYSYAVSHHQKRIMILGFGKNRESLSTILINDEGEVLARSQHRFDKDVMRNFHQVSVGDDGTLLLTTYAPSGSKDYSDEMIVYSLAPGAKRFVRRRLPLGDQYISGLYSTLDAQRTLLYSAAFYSDRKSGNLEGILYAVFDPSVDSFTLVKKLPFTEALIRGADVKNKKKAFNDFQVRQLIVKHDGGFLLISENAYVTSRTSYTPGYGYYSWYYYSVPYATSSITEYHYGDILAVNFDSKGKILWHEFIRKRQYSQEDQGMFSSYGLLNTGGSLAFLFNNFSARNSTLNLAVLRPDGTLQIATLDAGARGKADWLPRSAVQTANQELIVPVLDRNNLFFARLAF